MTPNLGRAEPETKSKHHTKTAVYVRYATQRKISPETAKHWFKGNVGGAVADVVAMAATAARCDRMDMVEEMYQRIRSATTSPPDYSEAWLAYNKADAVEDFTQADFDAREREGLAHMADARKRLKGIQREIAAARQYADALVERYSL